MSQLWLFEDIREPSVTELWTRLERYLSSHAPTVLESLNPPAAEGQIAWAEAELKMSIPAELKESLRIHNGQSRPILLVPSEYDPQRRDTIATWGELLSVEEIVVSTRSGWRGIDQLRSWADRYNYEVFEYDGPVRRDGHWSWMRIVDPGSGDAIGLDLNPAEGGKYGQILSIEHDPARLLVLASSYRAWFERLVERFESGRYVFAQRHDGVEAQDALNPE